METIKPPKPPGQLDIECRRCKAVMRCAKSELRFKADQRDGNAYVLTCPHCQHATWVSASLFPEGP